MATVNIEQKFKASPAQIWDALTNPESMKAWYFNVQDYALEKGNVFSFYGDDQAKTFLHVCEILHVEALKVFEHTWTHPNESKGSSILRWEIEPIDADYTLLKMSHSGLESFADAGPDFKPENYEFGWSGIVPINLRNYLYGFEKLKFEMSIAAAKEKVWKVLWDQSSYKIWAAIFAEGSTYEGKLAAGERVYFVNQARSGIYSDVVFMIPNELMIFSHLGMMKEGEEMPLDEATELWTGIFESYRIKEKDGVTTLGVELDAAPEMAGYFNEKFPLAVQKIKELSEQ